MRRPLAGVLILGVGTRLGVAIGGIPHRGQDPPFVMAVGTTTTVPLLPATQPTTTTASLRPPADVKVLTVNASGAGGRAATLNRSLVAAGYAVVGPGGNAPRTPTSSVYWTSGSEAEAGVLAGMLAFPADSVKAPHTRRGRPPSTC